MNKRGYVILACVLLVGFALAAPGSNAQKPKVAAVAAAAPSAPSDAEPVIVSIAEPQEVELSELERAQRKLEAELAKLHEKIARQVAEAQRKHAEAAAEIRHKLQSELHARHAEMAARAHEYAAQAREHAEAAREQSQLVWLAEEESGWLGVSIAEVSAEKAKELKLAAERGVLIKEVESGSPAAKAGLKVNDVVTEFAGQRVEGTAQFRRLVRETPAGRTVQLSVWREGRTQTISVQLGSLRDRFETRGPRVILPDFDFKFDFPRIEIFTARTPTLGIDAEDLTGQLGEYFGAPGGEGVLVREVRAGSPAEKAGVKAGDVIIKFDGAAVKTLSDLRAKLREKREQKTVSLGIIRKGAQMSLNVEIEQPKPVERRRVTSRRIIL